MSVQELILFLCLTCTVMEMRKHSLIVLISHVTYHHVALMMLEPSVKVYMYVIYVLCIILLHIGPCNNGSIRLDTDENYPSQPGIVEVCMNSTWYTVCNYPWTKSEASVVCSQLGYSPYG